mmetsp:Transcript_12550/g.18440  ORF Transcript_12550/g.18440 Transcript_12550/m.18440 type:complete len:396 (-) Transcript_12550:244-1431(-)|eukprot:CAMPEP_0194213246 /NCGR_PEP_ID=MMETSP0156-20130528/13650_1 /TAXON_ID=33649 /ORGANISM="Thalassionema nitzschioides, Strain L26-B" /LENGTH=395 /DNA_ID=CAMNT_0038941235 /DNA_START=111 /DNA_END=1298 /DNA_ORIENTATION=-
MSQIAGILPINNALMKSIVTLLYCSTFIIQNACALDGKNIASGRGINNAVSPPLQPPDPDLKDALKSFGLENILNPINDLGYYGWIPDGDYRPIREVSAPEIKNSICLKRLPRKLDDLQALQKTLPRAYEEIEKVLVENKYPYGQTSIASLYVAKEKGLDLNDVNFLFGSYTLYALGFGDIDPNGKLVLAKVPETNITLITRYKDYTQDYSQLGMQFERIVLGEDVKDPPSLDNVVHLQLMDIVGNKVLLAGEVDAMDDEESPVEIKSRYGNRPLHIILQMISSGCSQLVLGKNDFNSNCAGSNQLTRISTLAIRDLATATRKKLLKRRGKLIQSRLRWLRNQLHDLQPDQVQEVRFNKKNGRLNLVTSRDLSIENLFPNKKTILELLGKNKPRE